LGGVFVASAAGAEQDCATVETEGQRPPTTDQPRVAQRNANIILQGIDFRGFVDHCGIQVAAHYTVKERLAELQEVHRVQNGNFEEGQACVPLGVAVTSCSAAPSDGGFDVWLAAATPR
jgi:hypothetical protein